MPKPACFFIAFLFSVLLHAQQLPLETYTPANGLADARVGKIFQDSKGRMYFLTREGFSIFDGQHFDNYGADENQKSDIFNDITEYQDGSVKLFSFGGVLYTIKNNSVFIDSTQKKLFSETNKVFDIGNDEKLILTNYFLLHEKDNRIEKLPVHKARAEYFNIENAIVYKQYLIFSIFVNAKLPTTYVYNYVTHTLTDSLENSSMYLTAADKKGNLFVYANSWKQFNAAALDSGRLKMEPAYFALWIPKNFTVFNIQFDSGNDLWITNPEKGYCRINLATKAVQYYPTTQGVLNNTIFMFEDAEKNFWFAASGRGIQKLQHSPLSRISNIDNTELSFVLGITGTENKECFINTSAGPFLNNKTLGHTMIGDRNTFYWQHQTWKYTDYKTITGSNGTVIHLDKIIPQYDLLDFQPSYTYPDSKGRMVIAGKTLLILNKDFTINYYKLPYFCDNVVIDSNDVYWCFLRSSFITRLELRNNNFTVTYYKHFPGLNPRYAIKWNNRTFIVATRLDGLKLMQWKNDDFIFTGTIDKAKGLSNNFVNVLLKKENNTLLAGTATGLDQLMLNTRDTVIENLSSRNTIFSSFIKLVMGMDSTVYCQTLDGQLFLLDTPDSLPVHFSPSVAIKKIMVNNEVIDAAIQHDFSYTSNNFIFSATAPSFLDNRNTRFHFSLTGNSEHWEQNTAAADFAINHLLPGKYQLVITIKFSGKVYPDQQLEYDFVIRPPFWKQWWFITLCIILSVAGIFIIIRAYFQRQLNKQKIVLEKELAIEQERTRMSRELHDGLGSMLSGIKHSFAAIKNELHLDDQLNNKFHHTIDKLNESIKELRNISHSMASESLLKYGLENSLNDFCRNMSEPGNVHVAFTALHIEQLHLTEEQTYHIFRIVQELIQNVIRHAHATEAIVQLSYNEQRLYVAVEDNGNGFDMETVKKKNGMGLKNIETRVKILKGKLDFQTAPGNGTSVLVEIPCT
ncbi:MAG: sensor histidine kinase [Bacteroidetes bacterium]|nr:sensor histidine kinase [Bacteroidota bacterium]